MAEYERHRIRRDMKQIRLEEEAMQAGRAEEKQRKLAYIVLACLCGSCALLSS